MVDIATITVNYKTRDSVLAMLRSLYRDIRGSALAVQPVIVDNASGDGIAETIAREFRTVSPQPLVLSAPANLGFSRGNNFALRRVPATYYFIANPDLVFLPEHPRTLATLHAFMESAPGVGIVAPRLQLPDGTMQPSCMRFPRFFDHPIYRIGLHERYAWARRRVARLHMTDVDHRATRPIDWATGAALFVRGACFRDVGFFDERYFMYFDDCDLCRTFWSRGWPVYYKGDVAMRHGHARSSATVPGLRALVVNPLTRTHLRSLVRYTWKWHRSRV